MGAKDLLRRVTVLLGLAGRLAADSHESPDEVADPRVTAPRSARADLPANDVAALVAGNSDFAFDLYGALRRWKGNLFCSPYSVSAALAMAYGGAQGETEEEMARTVHFAVPQDRLHNAFSSLDRLLASRGARASGQQGRGFRLTVANSLWGQSGYQFRPQYSEILAKHYGATPQLADFQDNAESARVAINDWVEGQTEGKIQDLVPAGAVGSLTRLVLADAVYFTADWRYPFDKADTRPRPFALLDHRKVDVPMMAQETITLPYARGRGYQAVEIPYDGDELSLLALLPDGLDLERLEGSLNRALREQILSTLRPRQMVLTLPKFSYQSTFRLGETLAGLGMKRAMEPGRADFSGMSESRDIFIQDVVHRALVVVDERGTEAAATSAVIGPAAAPIPKDLVVLTLDRPFVYLIRDAASGTVLFLGRLADPRE